MGATALYLYRRIVVSGGDLDPECNTEGNAIVFVLNTSHHCLVVRTSHVFDANHSAGRVQ